MKKTKTYIKEKERAIKYHANEEFLIYMDMDIWKCSDYPPLRMFIIPKNNKAYTKKEIDEKKYYIESFIENYKTIHHYKKIFLNYFLSFNYKMEDIRFMKRVAAACNQASCEQEALFFLKAILYGATQEHENFLWLCCQEDYEDEDVSYLIDVLLMILKEKQEITDSAGKIFKTYYHKLKNKAKFWVKNVKDLFRYNFPLEEIEKIEEFAEANQIKAHAVEIYKYQHNPIYKLGQKYHEKKFFEEDYHTYFDNIPEVGADINVILKKPAKRMEIYNRDYFLVIIISTFTGWKRRAACSEPQEIYIKHLRKYIIYDVDNIYFATKKFFPATLKQINTLFNNDFMNTSFLKELKNILLKHYHYPILKDVLREKTCLLPLSLSTVKNCYNMNQLFQKNYKNTKDLCFQPQKRGFNISYLILKSLPFIKKEDRPKIMQMKEKDININDYLFLKSSNLGKKFITDYFIKKFNKNLSHEEEIIIMDYINMVHDDHKKVNLKIQSFRRLKEEHDKQQLEQSIKRLSKNVKVKIPKNSQFNELSKLLPTHEFEWIKTPTRLIKEAVEMHHCVWSYDNFITKDICAIYSFIFPKENKRYTVEFRKNKNKNTYYINQLQSANNQGHSEAAYQYVSHYIQ